MRHRISKSTWGQLKGLKNPYLFRVQKRDGRWKYYASSNDAYQYVPSV